MHPLLAHFSRSASRFILSFYLIQNYLILVGISYAFLALALFVFYRLAVIIDRPPPAKRGQDGKRRGHLLVVLGSGGHTSEMLSVLQNLGPEYLNSRFERRTWVVSSGDGFSAERARRFETWLEEEVGGKGTGVFDILTVSRARKIHQSVYTAPWSSVQCLWDCLRVLGGTYRDLKKNDKVGYPDVILTNGPATGVVMVVASILLMFVGLASIEPKADVGGAMRSVYTESWARVKTLSLSGRILRYVVSRFLVQWRALEDEDLTKKQDVDDKVQTPAGEKDKKQERQKKLLSRRIEYVGPVVT